MKGEATTEGQGNRGAAWGYSSLVLVLAVLILSIPRVGVVPYFFGYTTSYMFAMLGAGTIAGLVASLRNRLWWTAVGVNGFVLLLMLVINNQ